VNFTFRSREKGQKNLVLTTSRRGEQVQFPANKRETPIQTNKTSHQLSSSETKKKDCADKQKLVFFSFFLFFVPKAKKAPLEAPVFESGDRFDNNFLVFISNEKGLNSKKLEWIQERKIT
jgi:hypothetical protein